MTHHSKPHSVSNGREWHGDDQNSERFFSLRPIRAAARARSRRGPAGLNPVSTILLICGLLTATLGRAAGPDQRSAPMPCDEQEVRSLEPGRPIKRWLAHRQQHAYQIELKAAQFLKVIVEQQGLDVLVQVSGPPGRQSLEFDSESLPGAPESVSLTAEAAGVYQLTVRPALTELTAGSYEIRVEELRSATEDDRALHEARQQYETAVRLRDADKYDAAAPLFDRVLATRQRILGAEHREVATTLNSLAVLYYYKGDNARAEPLSERALAIRQRALGPDHPEVAASLSNLALLHLDRGDYEQAETLARRALAIRSRALEPLHPSLANYLHNLALIYHNQGRLAQAEPLYRRALAIRERAPGPQHPLVAQSLNNLANIYRERGDYRTARRMHQRALTIREQALGPNHAEVAESLANLASIYRKQRNYAKAAPLYERAAAIRERALGPQRPVVARSLNELATLYAARGETARAVASLSRANAISEHNLALNLARGSERQKRAYLATLSKQADLIVSLHLRYAPQDPQARDLAATVIQQRKARALDAAAETLNLLRDRFNADDQALLDRLIRTRSQIARLALGGPQNLTAGQYQARIKELEDQADKDEADISRRSGELRIQPLPVTRETVQAAIPSGAALIEFASYRPFDAATANSSQAYGPLHYAAYVWSREGEIRWKELGPAKPIDEAIALLRRALCDPKRKDVKRLARALDRRIFQPLRPLVGERTRLLISPDGSLNLLPFAALVDERGKYLVERFSISYLISGRDLLRLQATRGSRSGPVVIADPDFGGIRRVAGTRLLIQKKRPGGGEAGGSLLEHVYFPELPYTEQEGEALHALLPQATLLTRRQASKTALMQVRGPSLLHIATHGFFLEDENLTALGRSSADEPARLLRQTGKSGVRLRNPLLRSGLALAGANEQQRDDNGILTALEVTGLNLWGTKLVVLSACDTAVGEVKNGDGVHGLRRALVLAGAETQVMSLWPVSAAPWCWPEPRPRS